MRTPKSELKKQPACAFHTRRWFAWAAALAASLIPTSAFACSACFGESGSPMGKGLDMGVIFLVGVVVLVLSGVAAFFIYLAKRSAAINVAGEFDTEPELDPPWSLPGDGLVPFGK